MYATSPTPSSDSHSGPRERRRSLLGAYEENEDSQEQMGSREIDCEEEKKIEQKLNGKNMSISNEPSKEEKSNPTTKEIGKL